jgi:hypothetical protein
MLGVIMLIVMALSSDVCLDKKTLISITSEIFTLAKCHCKNVRESKKLMYSLGSTTSVENLNVIMLVVIMLIVMALSSDVCLEKKTLISITSEIFTLAECHCKNVRESNLCTPWAVQQVL